MSNFVRLLGYFEFTGQVDLLQPGHRFGFLSVHILRRNEVMASWRQVYCPRISGNMRSVSHCSNQYQHFEILQPTLKRPIGLMLTRRTSLFGNIFSTGNFAHNLLFLTTTLNSDKSDQSIELTTAEFEIILSIENRKVLSKTKR